MLQVELLEQSFEQVKPRANEFVESFYRNLFTDYPAAQPLFAQSDMVAQRKKLLDYNDYVGGCRLLSSTS